MRKTATINFIHHTTPRKLFRVMGRPCIAFDLFPGTRKKMVGFGVASPVVAREIANIFIKLAEELELELQLEQKRTDPDGA